MYNINISRAYATYTRLSEIAEIINELITNTAFAGSINLFNTIDYTNSNVSSPSGTLSIAPRSSVPVKRRFAIDRTTYSTHFQLFRIPSIKKTYVTRIAIEGLISSIGLGQYIINAANNGLSSNDFLTLQQTICWTTESGDFIPSSNSWSEVSQSALNIINTRPISKPKITFDSTQYLSELFSSKELAVLVNKLN